MGSILKELLVICVFAAILEVLPEIVGAVIFIGLVILILLCLADLLGLVKINSHFKI